MHTLNELRAKLRLIVVLVACLPASADDLPTNDLDTTLDYIVAHGNEDDRFSISITENVNADKLTIHDNTYILAHRTNDPAIELTLNSTTSMTDMKYQQNFFGTNISTTRIEFRKIDPNSIRYAPAANSPGAFSVEGATHDDERLNRNVRATSTMLFLATPTPPNHFQTNYSDNVRGFSFLVAGEQKAKRIVNALKHATMLSGGTASKPDPFDNPK